MRKLLFIDSDDIETLSEALQSALERRGINFSAYGICDDDDDDDYIGTPHYGDCGGGCGGGCGDTPSYGGCGGSRC